MNKSKYINLTLEFGRRANDDRWDIPWNQIHDFKIFPDNNSGFVKSAWLSHPA